ncbi:hypothetical protein ODZ83_05575 [Acaricomes phytoseiuli]|uniref:hypothetical protein n=1 Tax=Acaricomes phytoseiuli TaxID=291968 RepID=UPI0022222029|nr:hypothetical protein [Acaricomes phytoseiuli]MCW1249661.1 hypothetical protein [Acaricomes phytoseiuli]
MAASRTKKKRHIRKVPKEYELVVFESSLFEDEFALPNLTKNLPPSVGESMDSGDFGPLKELFATAGTPEEDVETFLSLDGEDMQVFLKEWAAASGASLPKS